MARVVENRRELMRMWRHFKAATDRNIAQIGLAENVTTAAYALRILGRLFAFEKL